MRSTVEPESPWRVDFSNRAEKQQKKLTPAIREILYILKGELEQEGPEQTEW
jgi:mRNA-degrading endonuclease RelE of RelBE toxin-antitoxin system